MKPLTQSDCNTDLAVDELQISWTLGITVSRSILGTGLVGRILLQATISIHRDEVQRTVQTAGQVRQIDVERELLAAGEFEHLICGVVLHQIGARSDVGGV